MLEKVIELLKQKEVWFDLRTNTFVTKKDSFVAPEIYVNSNEIIASYSKFLSELDVMYKQLNNIK